VYVRAEVIVLVVSLPPVKDFEPVQLPPAEQLEAFATVHESVAVLPLVTTALVSPLINKLTVGTGGIGLTVNVAVAERPPTALDPVMVIVYVPGGVDACVASVIVEVHTVEGVHAVGLNVAIAPLGRPDAVNETEDGVPARVVAETCPVVFCPCITESVAGPATL
jgi:hypothetical protein